MAFPPAWQAFLDDPYSDKDEVAELAEVLDVDLSTPEDESNG